MTVDRWAGRETLLLHLRHRGILTTTTAPPAAPARGTPLSLGIPGIRMRPDGEVTVDGNRCTGEYRRLSDLLGAGSDQGIYFADRRALRVRCGRAYDPVVYQALRSFLPAREKD